MKIKKPTNIITNENEQPKRDPSKHKNQQKDKQ